jgi:arylsulfatase A-like enzyme
MGAIVLALVLSHLLVVKTYATTSDQSTTRPNIVFVLADDMGYGDVHAINPKSKIATPNLDGLVAAGMTFTDAHTPSGVCTPTRYGLLTGRYCWRSRLKRGVLNGYSDPLIETDRPTVASFLKSQDYSTGIVGKWHLGLGWVRPDGETIDFEKPITHGPNTIGFDYSYVIPASLDFPPYVFLQNHRVTDPATVEQPAKKFPDFLRKGPRAKDLVMEEVLDHLAEEAAAFIGREAKGDKPFFLYFPLTAPHKPVLPHPRFRGKSELGPYGDFIVQVDVTVGRVLKAIDDAGVAENTLVIYTSDNGSFMHRRDQASQADHVSDETIQAYRADHHTSNYVFRGTKADIWEGGHHVPFFARWPKKVKAGTKCDSTICLTDFFATAANIIEAERPDGAAPDSFSFLPALSGSEFKRPVPVIHHSSSGMFAIRSGPWKLVAGNGSGGREAPRGKPFAKPFHLLNLVEDISERTNLIKEQPDVAATLEAALDKIRTAE